MGVCVAEWFHKLIQRVTTVYLLCEGCKPDWSSGVDLGHHLLPPTDRAEIPHFPQSVVLYNIAHSKGGAGATLVEGFAGFYSGTQNIDKVRLTQCRVQPLL